MEKHSPATVRFWPGSRLRRRLLAFVGAIAGAAVIVGFTLSGNGPAQQPGPAHSAEAVPVVAGLVQRADVPVYLTGIGTVQAFNSVVAKAQVDGQIVKIDFKEGQDVGTGDVLAEIDRRPFAAALAKAKAVKLKDEALLENAQLDLRRYQTLASQNSIAHQKLDTQAALVDQYRAAIADDEAQIDLAALQLSYCSIRSPIDGRIGTRLVDAGNIVRTTDTNGIATINQIHPISVTFALPAATLPELRRAMKNAEVVVVAESDDGHHLATGKLAVIDNQINTATATIGYKAEFANRDDALWPGQFVKVRVLVTTRRNVVTAPATALLRGPDETYVFVIGPDHRVRKQAVTVSWSNHDLAVIDHGLAPGQQVVVDGQSRIESGTFVDAVPPQAGARR
ncbi:MAG TPA: efflux RND transporter periplasmic adaptor subunit [Stellaceae bacterium]|nr:efflux RND transporter periplasmic adaptor subunit [Stellaceae bacterium]